MEIQKIKKNVEPKDKPEPYEEIIKNLKLKIYYQKLNQNLQKIF